MATDVLSDELLVKCRDQNIAVTITSLGSALSGPAVSVPSTVLETMSFEEAARFLGERIILLSPVLRNRFRDYLWSEDGRPPIKK